MFLDKDGKERDIFYMMEHEPDIVASDYDHVCSQLSANATESERSQDCVHASNGALDVLAERRRQIEGEGWDSAHDDAHSPGTLSDAGACYAMCGYQHAVPSVWPFDPTWWKPGGRLGRRKDLVKAAALIIAEIDRMDRHAAIEGGAS